MNYMKTNEVFDTFKMLLSCVDFDKFYNQSNFLPEEIIIEFIDSIKDKNQIIIHQPLSPRCIDVLIDKVNPIQLIQYQQLTESQIKHLTNKNKLLWNIICQFQSISYDFILDNIDNLKWETVIKYQKHLSETFIEEHQEELKNYWNLISQYQVLSEEFIIKHRYDIDWYLISQYQVLSESFIRENRYDVEWKLISQYQVLSEEFIYEFRFFINWIKILSNQNISEEFFYKVEDFIPWDSDIISRYVFSLKFLNHYKDKLNWEYVYYNENQPLIPFEEFDKIVDLIDWNCISTNKNLNEEFINYYQDRLNWNLISRYYNCSEDFIRKNKDKVSWYYIANYQNVSDEFLEEFNNYLRGI